MKLINTLRTYLFPHAAAKSSRTVRYAFPVVMTAVAFLGAQAIVSQGQSDILITPSTDTVRAGESFSLSVAVSAHVPVNAVDIILRYPSDQVEITGIDTGESVITLWTEDPYVEGDEIIFRGGTFRRGFVGEHHIAVINATAKSSGIAEVNLADVLLLAGDGSGSEVNIATEDVDTKVYIANADGSFEPGTDPATLRGSIEIFIATDIDGDGEVSLVDVSRFMSAWFDRSSIYDFNGDGSMTFTDFGIMLSDSFFR